MVACAVKACNNSYRKTVRMKGEKIKFFRFPKDPEIAAKWIEVCRKNVNITHGRICSTHFERWCYEKSAQQIALNYSPVRSRKLKLDAIPTLHLLEELQVTERLDVPIPSIHIDDASKSAATPEDIVPVELKATSKTLLVQTVDTESSVATSKDVSENIIVPIPSKSDTSIDYLVIIKNLQQQLANMQKTIVELKNEKKFKSQSQKKHQLKESAFNNLRRIFTPGQIQMIIHPEKKRVVWSSEDIASAISLRCVSPKAYRYLRNVIKLPLPGLSTLRRHTTFIKTHKKSFPRRWIQNERTADT